MNNMEGKTSINKMIPVSFTRTHINDKFWTPRIETNQNVTIPIVYEQCKKTGRIDAFEHKRKKEIERHRFWDSDVAKWVEAASYDLVFNDDEAAFGKLDKVVKKIINAQQPDGYLNSYFTYDQPKKRWKNIRDWHELYCAGHLIEAAVAYTEATNKREFLDTMCRYADYIDSMFGKKKGKMSACPGHQEIELALVKLYRFTGEKRYLKLAKYFIDGRGSTAQYFDNEARARGEQPENFRFKNYEYCQAHKPVREQKKVVGHAVRALYMYCGMIDVAVETDDRELIQTCKQLWKNLCEQRMLITGGVGTSIWNEGFTFDYDLPTENAYSETCAAIANVFFNHRLLEVTGDGKYGDVMELALYNGALNGVSLDGSRFFYSNPLASYEPEINSSNKKQEIIWDGLSRHRNEWYGCACCPPNIARLLSGLGRYIYSESAKTAWVHLYINSSTQLNLGNVKVDLVQETNYPRDGKISITVTPEKPLKFGLKLRIPAWCRKATLKVKGERINLSEITTKGYVNIMRKWEPGDVAELNLDMPVERIYANPNIRQLEGRVALQRGPIIYCLETEDNETNILDQIALPTNAKIKAVYRKNLLGGVTVLTGNAELIDGNGWNTELYRVKKPKTRKIKFTAVPYCLWDNRSPGSMQIWLRES